MDDEKYTIISNFIKEEINMQPRILERKISSKKHKFNARIEFDSIKHYIDSFIDDEVAERFIVLPGLRGTGKTTILFQVFEYLLKNKNIPSNQIIYISCEELNKTIDCSLEEFIKIFLKNEHDTNIYFLDKKIFLLIDESQYLDNWSLSGKLLFDKSDEIFMIFTGSSALHLEYNADSARRMLKKTLTPLNYSEHLKLRYNIDLMELHESLKELIFTGNVEMAIEKEKEANAILINDLNYISTDWEYYLMYGGFPVLYDKESLVKLVNLTEKVINQDMVNIMNFSYQNQINANRILRYLASHKLGETSQYKLSNFFKTSTLNIKNLLDTLEKTHLIFHTEPYTQTSKRIIKSWKYYFATSSLKNALSTRFGNTSININEYNGGLLENLIASNLYNLSIKNYNMFNLYFDANKKSNVDFLIQHTFDYPIPIEVGSGKKDKKQIKNAMNRYGCEYGIVVSNKTLTIEKDNDIIFVPPKTFSYI